MRILAIGSQELMNGFALLGIETYADIDMKTIEQLLNKIIHQQQRALIYLQQDYVQSDLPVLEYLRKEGGNILISEIPSLSTPDRRHAPIDKLIAKVIGPSALEEAHE